MQEQLRDYSVVFCQWQDQSTVQLLLNTGLLITIQINLSTADIDKMAFERFLIGKVPDHICDGKQQEEKNLVCLKKK